ncbi:MAG: hypothetical protein WC006_05125 [Bacilli bacterium]|nr:hypothetical protein [Bacilli bacterium]
MDLLDFLIYAVAVLVSGSLSIPFSAMIARKRPLLVFLLPLILGVLSLIFYIVHWTNNGQENPTYYILGLYSLLASAGSIIGSIYIILVRKHYRI